MFTDKQVDIIFCVFLTIIIAIIVAAELRLPHRGIIYSVSVTIGVVTFLVLSKKDN